MGAPVASTALRAATGRMAEPAIAVDPSNAEHIAVAADPYLDPVRIQVTVSEDGGQSWASPIEVRPDGFAKSYDPSLAFDDSGRLFVVGGASGIGQPHCQTGSAIFQATVEADAVTYSIIRDARTDGAYVDRPRSARVGGRSVVTWTESTGPGAECRGVPAASVTMLSRSIGNAAFEAPRVLPSSGFGAPFGTSRPVQADGRLLIVVAEHDGAGRSRAVLVASNDDGRTFLPPRIAWEGATTPLQIVGVGGLVAPLPSLALHGSRIAIAWSTASNANATLIVVESGDGSKWTDAAPAQAAPGTTESFAEVAYDEAGELWLTNARFANGTASINQRRRVARRWTVPTNLATGASAAYQEFGQTLGLALTPTTLYVVAPLDAPFEAVLAVVALQLPRKASPGPIMKNGNRDTVTAASDGLPRIGKTPSSSTTAARRIEAGLAIFALLLVTAGAISVRRRRARKAQPAAD